MLRIIIGAVLIACAACVTRAQVCVETSHSLSRDSDRLSNDSVGASACVDVEPPQ